MARPERNEVDYFPFICEEGNKMFYIEERYGNDGFATFVKLLRELSKTNYHYLNLSKPSTMMYLSAKCKVSIDTLESIIIDLVELGKFDRMLWDDSKVLWCQDLIDSIQDAYKKRKNKCITYEGLLTLLHGLGVRKLSKSDKNSPVNPQSKVEYSKEEKSKVDNSDFIKILKTEQSWIETVAMQQKITPEEIPKKLDEFEVFLKSTFKQHKSKKELASHFVFWLPKNIKINGESNSDIKISRQTVSEIEQNSRGW